MRGPPPRNPISLLRRTQYFVDVYASGDEHYTGILIQFHRRLVDTHDITLLEHDPGGMFGHLQVKRPNSSELNDIAPSWVQEPNGRGACSHPLFMGESGSNSLGTWKIIYSCCFTLSLCVVTAIHL